MWLALLFQVSFGLEIFLVPHSHCDPGWIEPIDWYYDRQVRGIFNNILTLFEENLDRKIVWSETFFLKMFMEETDEANRQKLRDYVNSGRIEFVGGGFSQSDEANSDLESVTRQIENGHKYLQEEFGIGRVKVGWQIDPFGHSAMTPSLWEKFGYEYLVINRIDTELRDQLRREKSLEFLWKGANIGTTNGIFTHVLYEHYDPPEMLNPQNSAQCLRGNYDNSKVENCAQKLKEYATKHGSAYRTDKVMILYGDDFTYMNWDQAKQMYEKAEKLRDYINSGKLGDITMKIATASEYFEAVKQASPIVPLYKGDFFPYVTSGYYWTGFYTTWPEFKQEVFETHRLLRGAELALAIEEQEDIVPQEASVVLHHDGITGTCRPHVLSDYSRRLKIDKAKALKALQKVLKKTKLEEGIKIQGEFRVLELYNSLNWEREELLHVESANPYIEIIDWNLQSVPSQAVFDNVSGRFLVYFKLKLPALSFLSVFVKEYSERCPDCAVMSEKSEDNIKVSDKYNTILLNTEGYVEYIKNGKTFELKQKLVKYQGDQGGAYIYRPSSWSEELSDLSLDQVTVSKGPIVTFLQVVWRRERSYPSSKYYYQNIILHNSPSFIWKVGTYATRNEEILMRLTNSEMADEPWFITSNSGDLRYRRFYSPETSKQIGMNMYPIPGGLLVKSSDSFLRLHSKSFIGAGIHSKDSFELLLHRNLAQDDSRGLAHGVNDNTFVEHEFEVELAESFSQEHFWESYYRKTAPVLEFGVVSRSNFELSLGGLEDSTEVKGTWGFKTSHSLGISDKNVYLMGALVKNKEVILKVKNFSSKFQAIGWKGLEFKQKMTINGFEVPESVHSWITSTEMEYSKKPDSGFAYDLPSEAEESFTGKVLLEPNELVAYKVEFGEAATYLEDPPLRLDMKIDSFLAEKSIENSVAETTETEFKTFEYALVMVVSYATVFALCVYYVKKKVRRD